MKLKRAICQCPDCKKSFDVSENEAKEGIAQCDNCNKMIVLEPENLVCWEVDW